MRKAIPLSSILSIALLAACFGGPEAFAMKWQDRRQSSNLVDRRFLYPDTGTTEELEKAIADFDSSSQAILSLVKDLSGTSSTNCSAPPSLLPEFNRVGQVIASLAMQEGREKLAWLQAKAQASDSFSREGLAKIDVCANGFDDLLKNAEAFEASAAFWGSGNSLIGRLLLSAQTASQEYVIRAQMLPAEARSEHAEALALLLKAIKENDQAINRLNARIADNAVRVKEIKAHLLKVQKRADCGISFL